MNSDVGRRRRFEAVVAEIQDSLERYLRRRAPAADVDDLMSEVLLVVWRRLDQVPTGRELPWSYAVARRTLANQRRGTARRLRLVERLSAQPMPPPAVDPAGSGDFPELAAALAGLRSDDREVLMLWAWEQLEPREIATVLDISANAAALRLSRARRRLGEAMTGQDRPGPGHDEGGRIEGHGT